VLPVFFYFATWTRIYPDRESRPSRNDLSAFPRAIVDRQCQTRQTDKGFLPLGSDE